MIVYRIRKTGWAQDRLTYRQLLEVMEILKGHFVNFLGNEQVLGELIDRLAKEEVLPKLMRVLLRPHARTRPGRWLNERRMKRAGITQANICDHMTAPEIARVLLDFFVLNVSWIQSWMPSATASIGTGAAGILQTGGVLSRLKKLSSTWQAETSASPTTTESKTP